MVSQKSDDGWLMICNGLRSDGKQCGTRVLTKPYEKVVCPDCGKVYKPYLGGEQQQVEVKNK